MTATLRPRDRLLTILDKLVGEAMGNYDPAEQPPAWLSPMSEAAERIRADAKLAEATRVRLRPGSMKLLKKSWDATSALAESMTEKLEAEAMGVLIRMHDKLSEVTS